ncbi:MAG: hypothetical protein HOP21_03505 [Methylotenera sp.]|nr:hypothetical protein [Methylotenera sp.]
MKLLLITVLLALSACTALSNPNAAMQPVGYKNVQEKIMFTTCSGSVEEWGSCFAKAKKTCPNSYDVIERVESAVGGKRELTFKCK